MTPIPNHELTDGVTIPSVGFGTSPMDDRQAEQAVRSALHLGYRLLDTAASYGNEKGVGRGISTAEVPRSEVFVTTKLRGRDQGYDETLRAFERSRTQLGLDQVDLYLIHWPLPRLDRYVESWRAMITLRDEGLVRSIGVSNFTAAHLDRLVDETGVAPTVNQIEMHPYFAQEEMREANRVRQVRTEAWRPLGRDSGILRDPVITAIADRIGRSPAQVVLRWHIQVGSIPIPKAEDPARQQENLAIFDVALTDEDVAAIAGLHGARLGGDPDIYEEL